MTTNTKMWNERCQVDMPRCKEMHLLKTRDSFCLDDRVRVILHHGTTDQAREARRRYRICVACDNDQHTLHFTSTDIQTPLATSQTTNRQQWFNIKKQTTPTATMLGFCSTVLLYCTDSSIGEVT